MIIKLLSEDPLHWLNVGISVVFTISEMPHIPICLDSGPASVQIWLLQQWGQVDRSTESPAQFVDIMHRNQTTWPVEGQVTLVQAGCACQTDFLQDS